LHNYLVAVSLTPDHSSRDAYDISAAPLADAQLRKATQMSQAPSFSLFAIAVSPAVTAGVEGYVRDEAGRPIRGVSVIALSKVALVGKASEAKTDEMGHYLVELPPGDYVLVFSATGYADKSADVSLRLGELKRVDAILKQAKAEFSESWGRGEVRDSASDQRALEGRRRSQRRGLDNCQRHGRE
jgi:hypothetical protein